jgi:hypothetical protein
MAFGPELSNKTPGVSTVSSLVCSNVPFESAVLTETPNLLETPFGSFLEGNEPNEVSE